MVVKARADGVYRTASISAAFGGGVTHTDGTLGQRAHAVFGMA